MNQSLSSSRDAIIAIALSSVAVALGSATGAASTLDFAKALLLALIALALGLLSSSWILVRRFGRFEVQQDERIQSILLALTPPADQLVVVPDALFAEIERRQGYPEVWIINKDAAQEFIENAAQRRSDVDYLSVVRENTDRGTRYVYIAPETPAVAARARAATNWLTHPDRVSFVLLSLDDWRSTPFDLGEFVVFNPESQLGRHASAYLCLPTADLAKRYWVRIDPDSTDEWIGRARSVIRDHV